MATTTRADKYTIDTKKVEYYSDFTTNLDTNPLTGYLARVTNEESVKQSLTSLLLTERTERFMQPWIGSKLNALLFEPNLLDATRLALETEIQTTIENCEPRVTMQNIAISSGQSGDDNSVYVTLTFTIVAIPQEVFSLDILINRIR